MPTYAYACTACGHAFDAVQKFSDAALTECPECEGRLRKVYTSIGVTFKGSGFYRNDSRASSSGASNGSGTGAEKSSSGEKSGESARRSRAKSSATSSDTSTAGSRRRPRAPRPAGRPRRAAAPPPRADRPARSGSARPQGLGGSSQRPQASRHAYPRRGLGS